jgi:hypothetical protein
MTIKYIFYCKPFQILPKLGFLIEKIPSGNPGIQESWRREKKEKESSERENDSISCSGTLGIPEQGCQTVCIFSYPKSRYQYTFWRALESLILVF